MKFRIPIYTYRAFVTVHISKNKKKLNKWFSNSCGKFGEVNDKFDSTGICFDIDIDKNGDRNCDVILDGNQLTPSLIAHEMLHAVCYILRYVDIPHSIESEEAYTCLLDHLVGQTFFKCGDKIK